VRIAVVCSDTGVRVPNAKGASLHLVAVATALARVGHDVMLVGVAGHGDPPPGVHPLLVRHPGRSRGLRRELRKLLTVDRMVRAARRHLTAFKPDVVYERLSLFGTAGSRLAAASGARHVVEVNALIAEEEARWRGLRLVKTARKREEAVVAGADLRVAVSEELAARVRRLAPGAPTAVVPNGVDAEAFARLPDPVATRARLGLPNDRPILGFAGSLRPWHGLDLAIDALPELPDAVLVVAGDGQIRTELESQARARDVTDRIRWLGQLDHSQVPGFLAALDVALVPYPALEDFSFSPLKVFEYLAAGVPIVAADIGQVRTVLEEGRWGTLVPPGDPSALAAGVRAVLDDPGRCREVAAEARTMVLEEHSWVRRARQLTDLFEDQVADALAT
jgi:glycosyltransferase involved in cell wall biosynthesis